MKSHIQTQLDLEIIRYSMVWEDYQLLFQGLDIQSNDHIFSIGSAGDNVLNLAIKNPQKITVVDFNPLQNALLQLKITAIEQCSYFEFITLLGFSNKIKAIDILTKIIPFLSIDQQNYWNHHQHFFELGLYKIGRLEHYFLQFVEILKENNLDQLVQKIYEANSLKEQQDYWNELKRTDFKKLFQYHYNQENLGKGGRSEIQYQYVKTNSENHFWKQIDYTLSTLWIKDSSYLSFFLLGKIDKNAFPDYLKEENFNELKENVNCIEIYTDSVETFFKNCPNNTFTKGNFSNLFEYLSIEETTNLFELIHEKFSDESKLAYWNLLNVRTSEKMNGFEYQKELSNKLHKDDKSWFYQDFRIDKIVK